METFEALIVLCLGTSSAFRAGSALGVLSQGRDDIGALYDFGDVRVATLALPTRTVLSR